MANVLVESSYLKAIANAIRNKLGVTTKYKPSEMAGAINSIVGQATLGTKTITANGTYDAEDDSLDGYSEVTVNVTPSGTKQISITSNGTTTENVADYASAEISVNVSGGGTDLGDAIEGIINNTITSFESDVITELSERLFNSPLYNKITSFKAHNVTTLGSYSMTGIGATNIAFPKLTAIGYGFNNATKVKVIDFGPTFSTWANQSTTGATNLDTLIFRKSNALVTCSNVSVVSNTKFKNGGTGGTIYIPKTLYDHLGDGTSLDYQSATNWSTIHGYGTITWASIEGSIYETQYADGTAIS